MVVVLVAQPAGQGVVVFSALLARAAVALMPRRAAERKACLAVAILASSRPARVPSRASAICALVAYGIYYLIERLRPNLTVSIIPYSQ